MLVLLLVPFLVLGLCAVAATLVGGRADRYMAAHCDSRVHRLPQSRLARADDEASDPRLRASG